MKKVYILIGCGGSGKSTRARELTNIDTIIVERDMAREQLIVSKCSEWKPHYNLWCYWKFKWEKTIDLIIEDMFNLCIDLNKNIVISNTNLNPLKVKELRDKFEALGYEVIEEVIGGELTLDDLWKRNLNRKNVLSHDVVAKHYYQFREQFPLFKLEDVSDKPKAVIFDVDGTICHMEDVRGPYEWDKVDLDKPDEVLLDCLVGLWCSGYKIIIMSGRDSISREKTEEWLNKHLGFKPEINYELFMRKEGDMRSDIIVKQELFFEHVDGKYKVVKVFDDRPKVIRNVWMEFGLGVVCCGNQNLEF